MILNFLEQLRASCEQRKIPLISRETQAILADILKKHQPKTCLEIGSAVGYSSIFIANIIQEWWGQLTSFEVAYPSYLEAQYNIHQTKLTNITLYPFDITKLQSSRAILPKQSDFVFIDAQKSQYGSYLEKIQEKLSSENTILLDDILKYQTKLDWLYKFLKENQINYEIFESEPGDGVLLIHNLPIK